MKAALLYIHVRKNRENCESHIIVSGISRVYKYLRYIFLDFEKNKASLVDIMMDGGRGVKLYYDLKMNTGPNGGTLLTWY